MRISITVKLIIYFLLFILVITSCIGAFSYFKTRDALLSRTFEQLTSIRIEKKNRIENFFNRRINDITLISNFEDTKDIFCELNDIQSNNTDSCLNRIKSRYMKYLSGYLQASNCYKRLVIYDPSGSAIYINIGKDNIPIALYEETNTINSLKKYWEKLKNCKSPVIEDLDHLSTDYPHTIYIGTNIKYPDQDISGMIVLEISINAINSIMYEDNPHNGLGKTGEAYLVGCDYLMRSSSRFINNSVYNTEVKTIATNEAFQGIVGIKEIMDYRKISVLSSYSKVNIPGLNWVILAEIDSTEAMVPIYSIRDNIVYLTLLMVLLVFGIVAVISSRITAPIRKLKHVTEKISNGEYGKTLNIHRNDEIGDLISAFNTMTTQLHEQSDIIEFERVMRTASMIEGQELERQRLSREIHDSLGQSILAIKMKLERSNNADPEKIKGIIADTQVLFKQTLSEIRNISNNLMPAVLNEFGFIIALKELAKSLSESTGIKIDIKLCDEKFSLSKKIEIYLYRIVQEALNNVVKHANAKSVEIEISRKLDTIILCIKDDGQGFIPDNKKLMRGNGIFNIKERISILGGKFEISSKPNHGTIIQATIQL